MSVSILPCHYLSVHQPFTFRSFINKLKDTNIGTDPFLTSPRNTHSLNSESQLLRKIQFRGIILQFQDLLKIIMLQVSWDNDFRSNWSDSAILMFLIHSKCCLTLPSLNKQSENCLKQYFIVFDWYKSIFFPKRKQKKIELFCPSTCLSVFLPSPFSDSFQYLYYAFFSSQYSLKNICLTIVTDYSSYSGSLCHSLFIINSNLYQSLIIPNRLHFLLYVFFILIFTLNLQVNCGRFSAKSSYSLTGGHDFWRKSSHIKHISTHIFSYLDIPPRLHQFLSVFCWCPLSPYQSDLIQ